MTGTHGPLADEARYRLGMLESNAGNYEAAAEALQGLAEKLGDKTADLDLSILLTPYRDGQPKPKITGQFPELVAAAPAR